MARVLIIEDNPDNLELMRYLLESFGHQALSACDGESGIAAAARERPDLIVCDMHLPEADGYEVARRLKGDAVLRRIPLVAVTALAMVGDRDKVMRTGFDSYISKPIDPQRFVADLEAFLPPEPPRGRPATPGGATEQGRPRAARNMSVLVVDDVVANRDLLREILEPFGYAVRTADCADQALALARERKPDLVLTDLHMPGADGFDLIRALKADPALRTLPLMVLSSSTWNTSERERALRLGVTRFLTRPIEPQRLIDQIEACLDAPKE